MVLPAELRLVAEAALAADGDLAEAQRATGLSTSEFYRRLREVRYRMFTLGLIDHRPLLNI
jgi:allophanate hydrolase subunit 1